MSMFTKSRRTTGPEIRFHRVVAAGGRLKNRVAICSASSGAGLPSEGEPTPGHIQKLIGQPCGIVRAASPDTLWFTVDILDQGD